MIFGFLTYDPHVLDTTNPAGYFYKKKLSNLLSQKVVGSSLLIPPVCFSRLKNEAYADKWNRIKLK